MWNGQPSDLDLGAAGLKLLPLFVDTEMGDPRWRPIFELLRDRAKPCIIDISWWYAHFPWFAPSVLGKYGSFTEYVQGFGELVADFPDVKIQLAHYGTPALRDRDNPVTRRCATTCSTKSSSSCWRTPISTVT